MTHAKTQRREEKRGLGKMRQLFGLRAPLRRFGTGCCEHESFATLRLCVSQKTVLPRSWRGTLHPFLA